jgi:glycine hydroxymethyltransferase
LADIAHVAGLIAAGVYPSPVGIADVTTTTTHKTLRGPRSGLIMAKANPELEKKLNSAVFPGTQGGPLMHVVAAKAVAFKEALEPSFKDYAQQVIDNAKAMVDVFIDRGFKVVSNGTENHMFLLDLIGHELSGKVAENCLEQANITTNKNSVPGDTRSPFVTSGLRLGSAAATTRGFKQVEMQQVAHWICDVLDANGDPTVIEKTKQGVLALCENFPVYIKQEQTV